MSLSKLVTITGSSQFVVDPQWGDPTKINTDDGNYTYFPISPSPNQTCFLYATINASQFSTTDIIEGIYVSIEKRARGKVINCRDVNVQFYNGALLISSNKKTATIWPSDASWLVENYGGSADMWSTTLTAADLNTGNIKLGFKAEKYAGALTTFLDVDYVFITIYYSIPTVTTTIYGPKLQSV